MKTGAMPTPANRGHGTQARNATATSVTGPRVGGRPENRRPGLFPLLSPFARGRRSRGPGSSRWFAGRGDLPVVGSPIGDGLPASHDREAKGRGDASHGNAYRPDPRYR